ncbi:DUF2147 domain-containing protein [Aliigemmobacter aestuarii]|uniref:DUF2147 domain-containing protein n=1 Tax=Aliigemmobacter aestuarii TaxID=1445661 RepID=A0A4S3MQZ8_9RHOB|nr:DUF2147 domain-containing protein [Gemmobacter aestuarii]THD84524.1 DUF2147 domain-containing protein [Gemmobacter aestuarii]
MRKLVLGAVLAMAATAAQADPIVGMWQTQEDDGAYAHVSIKPCGGAFCGTIAKTFKDGAEYASENIGKQIVIDMVPAGGGKYEGKVWRPSNNKIYVGKIDLAGSAMKLSGCVAGGLICAKQNWQKVN